MPMWCPPTPPREETDVYIDHALGFLYEQNAMPETQLPPIYVGKPTKRSKLDPALVGRTKRMRNREDGARAPRSLFERPSAHLSRRELKMKYKQGFGAQKPKNALTQVGRPTMDTMMPDNSGPEWLIYEDWALLQAMQSLCEMPLSLQSNNPAHTPNWDLVADVVNATSRCYRSPRQCKIRYENHIMPREEGKQSSYDVSSGPGRKQKKQKGIYKTLATSGFTHNIPKTCRVMRTSQLYSHDQHAALTSLHSFRFDNVRTIAHKRQPTIRPTLANPTLKNSKHTMVLAESGIKYDCPLDPQEVASIRAERIAKEKKAAQEQMNSARSVTQTVTVPSTASSIAVSAAMVTAPQLTIIQGPPLGSGSGSQTTVMTSNLQKVVGAAVASQAQNTSRSLQAAQNSVTSALTQAVQRGRVASGPQQIALQEIAVVGSGAAATAAAVRPGLASTVVGATTQATQPQSQVLTPQLVGTSQQRMAGVTTTTVAAAALQQQFSTSQPKTLTAQHLAYLKQPFLKSSVRQQNVQQARITAVQNEHLKQTKQQLRPQQPVQHQSASLHQKPLITSVAAAAATAQPRVQAVTKQTVSTLSDRDLVFLRNQTMKQMPTKASQSAALQQGPVTRILAGTPMQPGSTPVATLVKTIPGQASGAVSSITIPVSAVSLGMQPKQTTVAGPAKGLTAVHNPLRVHQFQRKAQTPAAQQQSQQKVSALPSGKTQLAPVNAVQIIQQPPSTKLPSHVLQHLVQKQKAGNIHQIITSVAPPGGQSSAGNVIATQIVTQVTSGALVKTLSGSVLSPAGQVRGVPVSTLSSSMISPSVAMGTSVQSAQQATLVKQSALGAQLKSGAVRPSQNTTVQHMPAVGTTAKAPAHNVQQVVQQVMQHAQAQQAAVRASPSAQPSHATTSAQQVPPYTTSS